MLALKQKKSHKQNVYGAKKATIRFELMIRVLQTHALPLGYVAISYLYYKHKYHICQYEIYGNDSDGNRTRVTAVKGRCLNRLTTEPYKMKNVLPKSIFCSFKTTHCFFLHPTYFPLSSSDDLTRFSLVKPSTY